MANQRSEEIRTSGVKGIFNPVLHQEIGVIYEKLLTMEQICKGFNVIVVV
jgi:hypothetical protein